MYEKFQTINIIRGQKISKLPIFFGSKNSQFFTLNRYAKFGLPHKILILLRVLSAHTHTHIYNLEKKKGKKYNQEFIASYDIFLFSFYSA